MYLYNNIYKYIALFFDIIVLVFVFVPVLGVVVCGLRLAVRIFFLPLYEEKAPGVHEDQKICLQLRAWPGRPSGPTY